MIRTFRYPLRPNKAQEASLDVYIWRCRDLYNCALEERIDAYRKQKITLTRYEQQKELTELRREDPVFEAVPARILRSSLKRLDLAYKSFFRRVKVGEKPGFPRFKGRNRFHSFSFMDAPRIEDSKILVPKLGWVRFHEWLSGGELRRERSMFSRESDKYTVSLWDADTSKSALGYGDDLREATRDALGNLSKETP